MKNLNKIKELDSIKQFSPAQEKINDFKLSNESLRTLFQFVFGKSFLNNEKVKVVFEKNGNKYDFELPTKEIYDNFISTFRDFSSSYTNELLTDKKLFPQIVKKDIENSLSDKNGMIIPIITDSRSEEEVLPNYSPIVIVAVNDNNELNLSNKLFDVDKLFDIYQKSDSVKGYIDSVKEYNKNNHQIAPEVDIFSTIFILKNMSENNTEMGKFKNDSISSEISKKFKEPIFIFNNKNSLLKLATEAQEFLSNAELRDGEIYTLIAPATSGKDMFFNMVDSLNNGHSFTPQLDNDLKMLLDGKTSGFDSTENVSFIYSLVESGMLDKKKFPDMKSIECLDNGNDKKNKIDCSIG